tara:strand:+ start:1166 stop:1942 length:777 start_codon:yes stop_codon:yes gene_type:complete
MGKFINVPLPLYSVTADMATPAVAGTSTGAATGKLTFATGTFLTDVAIGNVVLETTTWTVSTVTAVDSDTVLSIQGEGNAALEASGATFKIWSAYNAYEFEVSSGAFLTDVNVGDIVINTTAGRNAVVTKVYDDTSLSMDRVIFDDNATDEAVVISQSGYGGRLVSLDNIAMVIPTAAGAGVTPVIINYKTKTAGNDVLTITIAEAQSYFSWQNAFEKVMIETLESEWKTVISEMPLIAAPVVAGKPTILYATGVVLA